MRQRTLILAGPALFALASACTLIEVPFTPTDASSGGAPHATGGFASGGFASGGGNGFDNVGGHVSGGAWNSTGGDAYGQGPVGGTFGYGGETAESELIVGAKSKVIGIHVDETHIYWLTHGTFNGTPANPNMDGALSRIGVNGGLVETGVSWVDRPVQLRMTSTTAYFWLQESPTLAYQGFIEADLETGWTSPIDVGASPPRLFYAFEDKAYISHDLEANSGVFEHVLGEGGRQVIWRLPTDLAADAAHIYFTADDGILYRAALDDPTAPEEVASGVIRGFELWNDQILFVGTSALFAMPLGGGEPTEVVSLPTDGVYADLRVAEDRYFVAKLTDDSGSHGIHTGRVSSGDVTRIWSVDSDRVWFGAESAFYIANGTYVQRLPLE